jgi:hypothetical protein
MHTVDVSKVRLLVETGGVFRRLARLSWSEADASLYISPPGLPAPARVGVIDVPLEPGASETVNFAGDFIGMAPYMSLHQGGACHASAGPGWQRLRTAPVRGNPLDHPGGGHLATIVCFRPSLLPTAPPPKHSRKRGHAAAVRWPVADRPLGVALWACADEASARANFRQWLTFRRPTLPRPLHIGINARPQLETSPLPSPVVVITGGWGAGANRHDKMVMIISPACTECAGVLAAQPTMPDEASIVAAIPNKVVLPVKNMPPSATMTVSSEVMMDHPLIGLSPSAAQA